MKVIFLDHQGVMYLKKGSRSDILDDFDETSIQILNRILIITGAEIVISSDWTRWVTFEEMCKFYDTQGIKKPVGHTSITNGPREGMEKRRSIEIINYLNLHPEITSWVSIDDIDMREYLDNFIWIENANNGIIDANIGDILRMLV